MDQDRQTYIYNDESTSEEIQRRVERSKELGGSELEPVCKNPFTAETWHWVEIDIRER
jgi:hypothetical protein